MPEPSKPIKQERILLVLRYLWENSDENHQVTIKDIESYLNENGCSGNRGTITADIEKLIAFGHDIVCFRSTQNRYFLADRGFETPEIKLLIDAVQSARFLTKKKSRELIEKLSGYLGPEHSSILNRQLYVNERIKALNESIYYSVDQIHTAIQNKKTVTFKYYSYLPNKEKEYKHNGQIYELSPYALIWNDDCYYAIGYSVHHNGIAKFRVDRMNCMNITENTAVPIPDNFDVADYFTEVFSMFDGDECRVELLCENQLMDSIIDRFGEEVETNIVDKEHFSVKTTVSLSGTFFGWVVSFGGKMKLTAPDYAVERFRALLKRF
ncbi:MAG: helix-turn-helix transcriptional regulator [Eubacteriales bacterium]|jgi:predicted DNA-binding transcriptional regulator YafY